MIAAGIGVVVFHNRYLGRGFWWFAFIGGKSAHTGRMERLSRAQPGY
jgi:hypothetical protein